MVAQQLGMTPGMLYHSATTATYTTMHWMQHNNTSAAPKSPPPILTLRNRPSIYDYTADDFELSDYDPLERIAFPIAV